MNAGIAMGATEVRRGVWSCRANLVLPPVRNRPLGVGGGNLETDCMHKICEIQLNLMRVFFKKKRRGYK